MSAPSSEPTKTLTVAELRHEHFAPLLNQAFTLYLPEGTTLQLRLVEAIRSAHVMPDFRPPFSLIFRCPELAAGQHIVQGTYTFEHPALGRLALFMVPTQPDREGVRYQCVFS